MKKIFTIIILLLSTSSVSFCAVHTDKNKNETDTAKESSNTAVDAMFGTWVLSQDNSILTLSISDCDQSGMTEIFSSDLKKGFFVQDEDFVFPEDISKLLGSKHPIEIKAGTYKVVHNADRYVVTFNL